jgi:antitoxin component YwqK of YwqJK toxin-antitoxin module
MYRQKFVSLIKDCHTYKKEIMLEKKFYANGQKVHELTGDRLTYSFKNGKTKAEGRYEDGKMEGEWVFYRETGQLWVVGNFKNNMKHGSWIRYDKNDEVEYNEHFDNGKVIKHKL